MRLDKFVEEKSDYFEIIGAHSAKQKFRIKRPNGTKENWDKSWLLEQEAEGNIKWINQEDEDDLRFKFVNQQEEIPEEEFELF